MSKLLSNLLLSEAAEYHQDMGLTSPEIRIVIKIYIISVFITSLTQNKFNNWDGKSVFPHNQNYVDSDSQPKLIYFLVIISESKNCFATSLKLDGCIRLHSRYLPSDADSS
jgi:hypothetical protein